MSSMTFEEVFTLVNSPDGVTAENKESIIQWLIEEYKSTMYIKRSKECLKMLKQLGEDAAVLEDLRASYIQMQNLMIAARERKESEDPEVPEKKDETEGDSDDEKPSDEVAAVYEEFEIKSKNYMLRGIEGTFSIKFSYDVLTLKKDWSLGESKSDKITLGMVAMLSTYSSVQSKAEVDQGAFSEPTLATTVGDRKISIPLSNIVELERQAKGLVPEWKDVFSAYDSSGFWWQCLIACYQTKRLTEKSFDSFFAMLEVNPPIFRIIDNLLMICKGLFPKLMLDKRFRKAAIKMPFMNYHTSYCSTPHLIFRAADSLGLLSTIFFPKEKMLLVENARRKFWDPTLAAEIPTSLTAAAYVYLEVCGGLPSNWYQGIKAISSISVSLLGSWRMIFRKFRELQTETKDIEKATSMDQLFKEAKNILGKMNY
nr:MAG: hypothetical protein [brine shrimp yue-like virus 7]UNI74184.1 MAG: hypothetical protein [brine shrimp yue-like virus 7]UNI74186.1 MAG: hypothetical protein [brine shrimp yue-like virus 7]UNI74188.1 MAG: hypothetical protein [brine shrimp yue-like virus 7]UNI74190.1 MAG: hypothetical protein [brine shrimp yue-like virus 7]